MIENLKELRLRLGKETPQLVQQSMDASYFANDDPRRMPRLSLEQQKKRAKELLRSLQAGEKAAQNRVYSAGAMNDAPTLKHNAAALAQCQHVIAKELGFKNWAALKSHIDAASIAQQAIESGEPTALDSGSHTLHIRCGSDIKHGLAIAGFCGDFLEFSDPVCQGPVIETKTLDDYIAIRTDFIARGYGIDRESCLKRMADEYSCLDKAASYESVYIWLEHDSYDQLILARLLDHFSSGKNRPKSLQLITVDKFPGVKRFNGIGQLPPDALRLLWRNFKALTPEQLAIGRQTWRALKSGSPEVLLNIALSGTAALPDMSKAVTRHLKELPGIKNGLSLVEELTLSILANKGAMNAARLFSWYSNHYEPLTFLGDLQYWHIIDRLAQADSPAIVITKSGDAPQDWQLKLTDTGTALLAESVDWLGLTKETRWVGGVAIDPANDSHWRIDRRLHQLAVVRC
jgi:Domain of unknown function (DUF1835)